ncbi:unnamed protein product [Larinioides sclopetarius]|uniref:C2H2-type domain-containing protein n=1 Tax=Larinioides sclopetarius TaxID=280406 RepID=A0AAV2BY66_9ARAC
MPLLSLLDSIHQPYEYPYDFPEVKDSPSESLRKSSVKKCPYCSYSSPYTSSKAISIPFSLQVKDGISIHVCSLCNYSTPYKWNLKTHMIVHTGERQYVCHICNKSFSLKWNLKTHMKIHMRKQT